MSATSCSTADRAGGSVSMPAGMRAPPWDPGSHHVTSVSQHPACGTVRSVAVQRGLSRPRKDLFARLVAHRVAVANQLRANL